ncbi:universal stress protein [Legionella feeleii]|uniref:Universal stress protein n=1 Tax=Legionella feeleii TaxID=453 RepID=A0A378IQS4_9GAMM|nr:universal stress protein [Legionella feeleii]STX37576.1 universal stress protein [Legionella feeleii]
MIYKKIMVAIDGSDSSMLALQEAIKLAAHAKAQLRLVHVIDENIVNYTEGYIDFDTLAREKYQSFHQVKDRK